MSPPVPRLPEGYVLHHIPPPVDAYVHLRTASGLTPTTRTQAEGALACTWYGVHVTHSSPSNPEVVEIVAMARIFGGGWYFHVADVATLPNHQRKGLGTVMVAALMNHLETTAEPGFYVNLLADEPGRKLYERFGFVDLMPEEMGMGKWTKGKGERKNTGAPEV